jgi:hypothetical protein
MAIGELVNDKLPKTPSRLIPLQFITRNVMSALCGLAIGLSGNGVIIGLVAGIVGTVAGTFGGATARSLLARTFGRDLPAALLEDAVVLGIAALALSVDRDHSHSRDRDSLRQLAFRFPPWISASWLFDRHQNSVFTQEKKEGL